MTDIAIRVDNLSKLYHIGRAQQRHDTLRDALEAVFSSQSSVFRRQSPPVTDNCELKTENSQLKTDDSLLVDVRAWQALNGCAAPLAQAVGDQQHGKT